MQRRMLQVFIMQFQEIPILPLQNGVESIPGGGSRVL